MQTSIENGNGEHAYIGEFSHRYVGRYELGVRVANRISMSANNGYNIGTLQITFYEDENLLKTFTLGDTLVPWWSSSENGFALLYYDVPLYFPVSKPIRYKAYFIGLGNKRTQDYGHMVLYIKKASEK